MFDLACDLLLKPNKTSVANARLDDALYETGERTNTPTDRHIADVSTVKTAAMMPANHCPTEASVK